MREIKFRGKRIDNNQIVFGCLVNNMWTYSELSQFEKGTKVCEIFTGEYGSDNWIDAVEQDDFIFSVYPHSVSQYTGLKDKNGVEIYEGDIVKHPLSTEPEHLGFIIEFRKYEYIAINVFDNQETDFNVYFENYEIIGNIHENPELIHQQKVN